MTQTIENFFTPEPGEPVRVNGNPQLVPKGLEGTGVRATYTRASGLASYIEESEHFHKWEKRYLAMGIAKNPDLAGMAAIETYNTGLLHPTFGPEKSSSARRLDGIIERAMDREGLHEKADYGTLVHGFTEPGMPAPPEGMQDAWGKMPAAVRSFWWTVQQETIDLTLTECFTANDATMTSGTFDHLCRFPGHPLLQGYVIGDKKTGRYNPWEWAVQLSTYAYGDRYDCETDERPGWPGVINLQWGVVFHVVGDATKLHVLDIAAGWEAAQHAAWVRDYHTRTDLVAEYKPASFSMRLSDCNDTESLRRLWASTEDLDHRARIVEKASTIS